MPLTPCSDPFADEADAVEEDDGESGLKGKTYVHVRVQQRNGRKSLTTVQARASHCHLLGAAPPRGRFGGALVQRRCARARAHNARSREARVLQGIDASVDYKKVLKAFKKEFCCNGTVVEDPEQGNVIQLQGDQRKNVSQFLITVRPPARRSGTARGPLRLSAGGHREEGHDQDPWLLSSAPCRRRAEDD